MYIYTFFGGWGGRLKRNKNIVISTVCQILPKIPPKTALNNSVEGQSHPQVLAEGLHS